MLNLILSFLNWNYSSFRVLNALIWYSKVVLERAHFSSISSFIELQNFEFKYIASSSFFHFSSLSSSLEMSFATFGLIVLSVSSFIKFEFASHISHRARFWWSLKFGCLNLSGFQVSSSSFKHLFFAIVSSFDRVNRVICK